jgi:hypothetical protein
MTSMTIEEAITATLADMIQNRTGCTCCDNNIEHAALIRRALARFPSILWPSWASCAWSSIHSEPSYQDIEQALRERRVTW